MITTHRSRTPQRQSPAVAAREWTKISRQPLGLAHRVFAERLQHKYRIGVAMVGRRLYYLGLRGLAHAPKGFAVSKLDFVLNLTVIAGKQNAELAAVGLDQTDRFVSGGILKMMNFARLAAVGLRPRPRVLWRQSAVLAPTRVPSSASPSAKLVVLGTDRIGCGPHSDMALMGTSLRAERVAKSVNLTAETTPAAGSCASSAVSTGVPVKPFKRAEFTARQGKSVSDRPSSRATMALAARIERQRKPLCHTAGFTIPGSLRSQEKSPAIDQRDRGSPQDTTTRAEHTLGRPSRGDVSSAPPRSRVNHLASRSLQGMGIQSVDPAGFGVQTMRHAVRERSSVQRRAFVEDSQPVRGQPAGSNVLTSVSPIASTGGDLWNQSSNRAAATWHERHGPSTSSHHLVHATRDIGPVTGDRSAIPETQRTVPLPAVTGQRGGYGSLPAPVIRYAQGASPLQAAATQSNQATEPVGCASSADDTHVRAIKVTDKAVDARDMADQVYGMIYERIKTELRMRGR